MLRALAALLVAALVTPSCGGAGHPCESPSTRDASADCRPPIANEVATAELLIARFDTPASPEEVAALIVETQPGLVAYVGYFVIPSDGPVTTGHMGLEQGVEGLVAAVEAALAEDGRTGVERLLIHAIGFRAGGSESEIADALDILEARGFELSLCTLPMAIGGCSVSPPYEF